MEKSIKTVAIISDLREKIDEICPEGYHFKKIITISATENSEIHTVIAFEEN